MFFFQATMFVGLMGIVQVDLATAQQDDTVEPTSEWEPGVPTAPASLAPEAPKAEQPLFELQHIHTRAAGLQLSISEATGIPAEDIEVRNFNSADGTATIAVIRNTDAAYATFNAMSDADWQRVGITSVSAAADGEKPRGNDDDEGLGAGSIAAIVMAVLVVLVLLTVVVVLGLRRRQSKEEAELKSRQAELNQMQTSNINVNSPLFGTTNAGNSDVLFGTTNANANTANSDLDYFQSDMVRVDTFALDTAALPQRQDTFAQYQPDGNNSDLVLFNSMVSTGRRSQLGY